MQNNNLFILDITERAKLPFPDLDSLADEGTSDLSFENLV